MCGPDLTPPHPPPSTVFLFFVCSFALFYFIFEMTEPWIRDIGQLVWGGDSGIPIYLSILFGCQKRGVVPRMMEKVLRKSGIEIMK